MLAALLRDGRLVRPEPFLGAVLPEVAVHPAGADVQLRLIERTDHQAVASRLDREPVFGGKPVQFCPGLRGDQLRRDRLRPFLQAVRVRPAGAPLVVRRAKPVLALQIGGNRHHLRVVVLRPVVLPIRSRRGGDGDVPMQVLLAVVRDGDTLALAEPKRVDDALFRVLELARCQALARLQADDEVIDLRRSAADAARVVRGDFAHGEPDLVGVAFGVRHTYVGNDFTASRLLAEYV